MMLIFAIADEADRAAVEAAVGVQFEPHDSLYLGEYWLAKLPGQDASLKIRPNVDPMWQVGDPQHERFAYPEYAGHDLILEAYGQSPAVSETLRSLAVLRFLRQDD